jgi:hypothetical protein
MSLTEQKQAIVKSYLGKKQQIEKLEEEIENMRKN